MTGVNGIKVKDGYICFDNTAAGILNRVAINGSDSSGVPGVMVGARLFCTVLGKNDRLVWICQSTLNTLNILMKNGSLDELTAAGVTACGFSMVGGCFVARWEGWVHQLIECQRGKGFLGFIGKA